MNIWIITTGSSDVQLKTKDRWNTLHSKVRSKLETKKQFSLSESEQSGQKRWLVPSRAMGVVYSPAIADHFNDLDFPLLNSFSDYLKNEKIELNRIIVILTDQSDVVSAANKDKPSHFYWQDTCTLKPLLEHYLKKNAFPNIEIDSERDWRVLKPKLGPEGLDNWNEVLTLIQQEFTKLNIPEGATVYVSHQAGTPAISSAVQFESLLRFRQQVKFLVSSEYDSKLTRILDRSTYLSGIQKQEAKTLLDRYDYSGVKELLNPYLTPEIRILLDAAIQWNFAKFDEFLAKIMHYPNSNLIREAQKRTEEKNWWWTAYEAAYLGVIRLEQGNTVEAMFHSFRAVEGLLRKWVEQNHSDKIHQGSRGKEIRVSDEQIFNLHGQDLYRFLKYCYQENISKTDDIGIFGHHVFKKRNNLFHQLEGLQDKKAVFENWRSPNEKQWRDDPENKWKTRVIRCLNFLSGETFEFLDKEDKNGEVASLMVKVHEELVKAIAVVNVV
ncbi:hypothetical protein PCC9214_05843 [Planktothrix tepida]|uniref:Uncharacterized protein n=1 Tax=Planktothrix tepida PCC 9214 TaxID=671072 RepID=A0A1J1LS72_9CYAN|nr:hypothetical protein [Planktothrix tepida]CAD5990621.1 hypothetical protein PCC9214_05843 [Planktothrix tepida]CUR35437.1 conserved hypothetical protein [Planktothrix tepida PCC 9214]